MSVECRRCGRQVSDRFARVLGDNDDVVHACPTCSQRAVGEAAAGISSQKLTGVERRP